MVAVAALHVSAIALYYAMGIGSSPPMRQRMFAWTWIVATAGLVFVGLQRIKRARRAGGAPPGQS